MLTYWKKRTAHVLKRIEEDLAIVVEAIVAVYTRFVVMLCTLLHVPKMVRMIMVCRR